MATNNYTATNDSGVTYALTYNNGIAGLGASYDLLITYPDGTTDNVTGISPGNVLTADGGTLDIASAVLGSTYVIPPGVTGEFDIVATIGTVTPNVFYVGGTATISSNIALLSGLTVNVDGGVVSAASGNLAGALSGLTVNLDNGGTFTNGAAALSVLNGTTVNFGTNGGSFVADAGGALINLSSTTITGFDTAKDQIAFNDLSAPVDHYDIENSGSNQVITLYASDGTELGSFAVAGTSFATGIVGQGDSGPLTLLPGASGVIVEPVASILCFCAGTQLATPDGGEIAVEDVRPGDMLLTADGRAMPVRWVGRSEVSTKFADPLKSSPVRIAANALADGVPSRDLLLSPDHALFIDGILVQANALVNGATITRESNMPELFTYYHVELEAHELLLAHGAAAESFVDNADRMHFANWDARKAPCASIQEMPYPRAKSARQVPSKLRARLAERASPALPERRAA